MMTMAPRSTASASASAAATVLLLLCAASVARAEGDAPHEQCQNGSSHSFNCPAPCFCGATWNASEVQSTDGLVYSQKYGLSLHMFQPPPSDYRPMRPAVVMIHGGGFKAGTRDDKQGIIDWSTQLAARGYVTVSIDYRINKTMAQDDIEKSMVWAAHDAKAAVRWLRQNAQQYRIDSERIGVFGSSAGAMTTIFMSALGSEGDSGSPGFSSAVRAAVSLSGALACVESSDQCQYCDECLNVTATLPPWLDFHGCKDSTVPYGPCGSDQNCWGSGVDTVADLKAAGVAAALYSFPGEGHVPWHSLAQPEPAAAFVSFLATHMDLAHAECPMRDDQTLPRASQHGGEEAEHPPHTVHGGSRPTATSKQQQA